MRRAVSILILLMLCAPVGAECPAPKYTGNAKKDNALYKAHTLCLEAWGREIEMRRQELDRQLMLDTQLMLQLEAGSQTRLLQEQNMLLEEQNDLLRKRRRY